MHTRALHMSMWECTWELHTFECVNAHESLHMSMCVMNAHESLHMHAHQSFTHLNVWMHTRAYAWVCVSWMYVCHECTLELTPMNAHESLHVWMWTWRIQQNLCKCNFWHGSLQIDISTNRHSYLYTHESLHMSMCVMNRHKSIHIWMHTSAYTYDCKHGRIECMHVCFLTRELTRMNAWMHTRAYTYECEHDEKKKMYASMRFGLEIK